MGSRELANRCLLKLVCPKRSALSTPSSSLVRRAVLCGAGKQPFRINMASQDRQGRMKSREKQQALTAVCDTTHWRAVVALTLNLKQSVPTPNGGFALVDEQACKKTFKRFCNSLNREVYGAAHRHHKKRLRIIPILEHPASGRWHYHVAIEPPEFMDGESLAERAVKQWEQTPLGYGHGHVCAQADSGWLPYMTKFRTKEVFEDFLDCLDVEALHNPIASA